MPFAQRSMAAQSRWSPTFVFASFERSRSPDATWCGWSEPTKSATSRGAILPMTSTRSSGSSASVPGGTWSSGPEANSQVGIAASCRSWSARNSCAPGSQPPS